MRVKQLRGLPVVDPVAAKKIGTVRDFFVDPGAGRLAGVSVDPRDGVEPVTILGGEIQRIGRHAVMLRGAYAPSAHASSPPVDRWLDLGTLDGLEVLGDDGDAIGHLSDAYFQQDSLRIDLYAFAAAGWRRWFGRRLGIKPEAVSSCSRELMIALTGRVAHEGAARGEESFETVSERPLATVFELSPGTRDPASTSGGRDKKAS